MKKITRKLILVFLYSICFIGINYAQITLTDLVDGEYPGKPWNAEPFNINTQLIPCWQFDRVSGTVSSDSGYVAGSYWLNDPENWPATYGQRLRQDGLDSLYAVFRYNGGAKVFRSSGQWLRYTINTELEGYYFFKFRTRQSAATDGYNIIASLETADSVNLIKSIEITKFSADAIEIENLGLTSWYVSKDSLYLAAGKSVIRIDIPGVSDEFNGQGKFGELGFISTDSVFEVKKDYICGEVFELEAVKDFSILYVDGYAPAYIDGAHNALAINAENYKDEFAAAQTFYKGPSGLYSISLTTLTELDGESIYKLWVNKELVGEFQNPKTSKDYEEAKETWSNITLKYGDTIQVDFNSHTNGDIQEGDGTAYSRGRWTKLSLLQDCDTVLSEFCIDTTVFHEIGGAVVVEMEHADLANGWSFLSTFGAYTGNGYIQWDGSNTMGSGGVGENIYKIQINTPGVYKFKWRTKNGMGAELIDEENDSWLKIDADDFYGMYNGNYVDCNNHWIKVWIHAMNNWSWNIGGEHNDVNGFEVFAKFNKPGIYSIHISGRSKGHMIDRMVLYREGVNETYATSSNIPESPMCSINDTTSTYKQAKYIHDINIFTFNNNLVVELKENQEFEINIINPMGQVVYKNNYHTRLIEEELKINNGVYIVVVRTQNTVFSKRVYLR